MISNFIALLSEEIVFWLETMEIVDISDDLHFQEYFNRCHLRKRKTILIQYFNNVVLENVVLFFPDRQTMDDSTK